MAVRRLPDSDILSQGEEREPSPRPRRLVVAVVLAVALGAVIVTHLPHHHPRAHPQAAASRHPVIPGAQAGLPTEPDGIIGPSAGWDARIQLPVAGSQPRWFQPATGRSMPIAGLPLNPAGYLFTRVAGGWAVRPNPPGDAADCDGCAACGNCDPRPLPVYFLASGAAAHQIGNANAVAPGATDGTLWVTSGGTAQEISTSGQPLRAPVRLPAHYQIVQGTVRGLLLAPSGQQPGQATDWLWAPPPPSKPATGVATAPADHMFTRVIAASAAKIIWAPHCTTRCHLVIRDLANGRDITIVLPTGSSIASGVLSPDRKYLAVQVRSASDGDSGASPTQLEVVTVATGFLQPVPGTSVSSDALDGFGWPASGNTLVAELSFTTKVQVASWKPGATRPAVVVIHPSLNLNLTAMIVG